MRISAKPSSGPKRLASFLLFPLLLLGAPLQLAAQSAAATVELAFDLPAQPLDQAVTELARRAGIVIGGDAALLRGRQAPALQGNYTPEAALRVLLTGTGIVVRFPDAATAVLEAAPATDPGAVVLGPVRVEGQSAVAAGTPLPGAGTVLSLDRKQLDRFPPASTGDIFKDTPGVMSVANRNGTAISLNVRGVQGMGRVKILVDGTQSTSNDYKGYAGDHDHSYVDPELLGGVTVEKGPNSGPYGGGAIGGVVSLRTLEANDLIRGDNDHGLRIRGTYGNNVNRDGSSFVSPDGTPIDIEVPDKNWSGSAVGAWRTSDNMELVVGYAKRLSGNYYAGSRGEAKAQWIRGDVIEDRELSLYQPGDEVFNTSQDTKSLLVKAKWLMPADQTFELGYTEYDSEYGEVRSAGYNWYILQQPLSSTRKKTFTGRYAWTPQDNPWWKLRANVWAVESDEVRATNPESGDTENQSHGAEFWNTTTFDLPWAGIDIKYGGSYFAEKVDVKVQTIYLDPDGERQMAGAFTEIDAQFGNWLVLHGGLRYDRYSAEGKGIYNSPVPGQNPVSFEMDNGDSRYNPSVGFTITPWQGHELQLFGRHSRGWRPPTIKETLINYVLTQRLLKPETATSSEAGVSFTADGLLLADDRFKSRLTWFKSDYDDYVIGFAGSFSNVDGAKFSGLEFSLEYDLGWAFLNYALTHYNKVEFCGLNKQLRPDDGCSNTQYTYGFGDDVIGVFAPPKQTENLTVGARLFDRRLTLGARMFSVGERFLKSIDGNTTPGWYMTRNNWAAHEIYDLFGSYRVYDRLEVGFSLENLRDRFYLDAGSNPLLAIPSPGRTTRVTLTYSF